MSRMKENIVNVCLRVLKAKNKNSQYTQTDNRELKQRQWRHQQKRHLKI